MFTANMLWLGSLMASDIGHAATLLTFFASGDFCCLLITFANRLDPDQDQD